MPNLVLLPHSAQFFHHMAWLIGFPYCHVFSLTGASPLASATSIYYWYVQEIGLFCHYSLNLKTLLLKKTQWEELRRICSLIKFKEEEIALTCIHLRSSKNLSKNLINFPLSSSVHSVGLWIRMYLHMKMRYETNLAFKWSEFSNRWGEVLLTRIFAAIVKNTMYSVPTNTGWQRLLLSHTKEVHGTWSNWIWQKDYKIRHRVERSYIDVLVTWLQFKMLQLIQIARFALVYCIVDYELGGSNRNAIFHASLFDWPPSLSIE